MGEVPLVQVLGNDHVDVANTVENIGVIYAQQGNHQVLHQWRKRNEETEDCIHETQRVCWNSNHRLLNPCSGNLRRLGKGGPTRSRTSASSTHNRATTRYRGASLIRNHVPPKDPTVGLCLGPYGREHWRHLRTTGQPPGMRGREREPTPPFPKVAWSIQTFLVSPFFLNGREHWRRAF